MKSDRSTTKEAGTGEAKALTKISIAVVVLLTGRRRDRVFSASGASSLPKT